MVTAIIAPVTVSKHPNADRLQIGNVLGYQVIVGLDVKDGDLGIYFPEGIQLSEEYARANDLVRRKNPDGSMAGGFFESSRRVRCQKFRGVPSEGYWAPLASLDFTGRFKLSPGDRVDTLNNIPICNKYITLATVQAKRTKNSRKETVMFHAHFYTDQLRFNMHRADGDLVVTLKMHGTSQRTGYVLDEVPNPWYRRFLKPKKRWTYLTGSRNVILGKASGEPYHSDRFRKQAADKFINKLHKGETVFYEIVGYEALDKPIMKPHYAEDKELKALYGDKIIYSYGCPNGNHQVYVYRITYTNEDGYSIDLPWKAVKQRCKELGVEHVPELAIYHDNEQLLTKLKPLAEGPDPIDPRHPREGVCVRVDGEAKAKIFKHKSFTFGLLEGYIKDDYIDTEEAA